MDWVLLLIVTLFVWGALGGIGHVHNEDYTRDTAENSKED